MKAATEMFHISRRTCRSPTNSAWRVPLQAEIGRSGAEDSHGLDSEVDSHPLSAGATRREGNDLLPNQKHEAKEDFSPVGPIVREIIWLK